MKGKSKEQVHLELLKMGAVFQWVDLPKLSEHRKSAFPEGITVNRSNPLPSPVAASGDRQKHGAMPTTRTAWNETKFYSKAMRNLVFTRPRALPASSDTCQRIPRKLALKVNQVRPTA